LNDTVFIDPQFVSGAVAELMGFKQPTSEVQSQTGILRRRDLENIWQKHPAPLHEKLLRLLENFDELIVQEHSGPSGSSEMSVIVPFLFDAKPPAAADRYLMQKPDLSMSLYYRVFAFQFITPAFVNKLLARCLQLKTMDVVTFWRNGLIATRNDEVARLEYHPAEYRVIITVLGHKTAALLVQLVSCVELLLITWFPKYQYDVLVPLPSPSSLDDDGGTTMSSSFRRTPAVLMRTTSTSDVTSQQLVSIHHLARLISCGGSSFPLPSPPGAFVSIETLAPDLLLNDLSGLLIGPNDLGHRSSWKLLGRGAFGAVRFPCLN
jgi:hypothetical protein